MNSSELGGLFENASFAILKELFQNWGYEIVDSKIQKSGTQHGFDLYFKIGRHHSFLNLFIECKASQSDNSISGDELILKLQQFDWANFPRKDVHIFFSPSREIGLGNQLLTIEDDSYPFTIIDWMRKADENNLIVELFWTYRTSGNDKSILDYCDFLFSKPANAPKTSNTFAEVCELLKQKFDRRVVEHNGKLEFKNFRIINGTFWNQVQKGTHSDYISYFYSKTDSTPARLREVVANDFYIKNIPASGNFDRKLTSAKKTKISLIKILSRGGEGKSTFLYHLAKTYYEDNLVIWLEDVGSDVLVEIDEKIQLLDTNKPLLFFLDNPAVFGKTLSEFANKLVLNFRHREVVLIVAERDVRYDHIEEIGFFEALFDGLYEIRLRSNQIRLEVFHELLSALDEDGSFADETIDEMRKIYLRDDRLSLAERTFAVLKYLSSKGKLKGYVFDWQDWEDFAKKSAPSLERLYLVVATFYQFGYSVDIDFCVSLLGGGDFISINSALGQNPNLPIYKRGRHLLLRHEAIASWFLDGESKETRVNLDNSKHLFGKFLANVDTDFARNLFIWVCIKSREFRRSEYAGLVDGKIREAILLDFIEKHPQELKSRTELSKIYQTQKKWQEAEDILLELKVIDPDNLQARTELSKIYQTQKKWQEAEDILLESLKIDNQQPSPSHGVEQDIPDAKKMAGSRGYSS